MIKRIYDFVSADVSYYFRSSNPFVVFFGLLKVITSIFCVVTVITAIIALGLLCLCVCPIWSIISLVSIIAFIIAFHNNSR